MVCPGGGGLGLRMTELPGTVPDPKCMSPWRFSPYHQPPEPLLLSALVRLLFNKQSFGGGVLSPQPVSTFTQPPVAVGHSPHTSESGAEKVLLWRDS